MTGKRVGNGGEKRAENDGGKGAGNDGKWIGRRRAESGMARFPLAAKSASLAKRNPENPAKPVNPDSDGDAQTAQAKMPPASSLTPKGSRGAA